MSLFDKFKLSRESFSVRGYTSENPDGEWIQDLLAKIKRTGLKSIFIDTYERGKPDTLYVFVNGHIVGSILKKDERRVKELLRFAKKAELVITTTNSGAGYSEYYKAEIAFYYKDGQNVQTSNEENRFARTDRSKSSDVDRPAGRPVIFDVVGVTFKNEDGESRQEILEFMYEYSHRKKAKRIKANLKPYEYKGKHALAVWADGVQVGNIAADEVRDVEKLIPEIIDAELIVDYFIAEDKDGKTIYSAKIVLYL